MLLDSILHQILHFREVPLSTHRASPHLPARSRARRRYRSSRWPSAATASYSAGNQAPNIVFILADDLGYADVACYGRPDLRTPNIDHLAAQGVRFLQAYANSAVCTATRTALITGRYQYRLRLGLEEPLVGNKDVGLEPSHPPCRRC